MLILEPRDGILAEQIDADACEAIQPRNRRLQIVLQVRVGGLVSVELAKTVEVVVEWVHIPSVVVVVVAVVVLVEIVGSSPLRGPIGTVLGAASLRGKHSCQVLLDVL